MTTNQVTVCIPWRPTPDRLEAYHQIRYFYDVELPDAPVVTADAGGDMFNRAASRNSAVTQAETSIVVVADADTVVEPAALHEAIACADDGLLHLPYTQGLYLEQNEGYDPWGAPPIAHPSRYFVPVGGVLVISKRAYWNAGGQDWRFEGWGGEDDAFHNACDAMLGPVVRHEGLLVASWHECERDLFTQRWEPNSLLATRYKEAAMSKIAMTHLLQEKWRAPLAG
jgi:hypothetical protein